MSSIRRTQDDPEFTEGSVVSGQWSVVYSVVMFTRLGSILKTTPSRRRNSGPFLALQVRQAAKEILDRVLSNYPPEFAKKVKVKTYKRGVLTISSPQLMSAELHMRSEGLKKDINGVLGKELINGIRFKSS